MVQAWYKNNDNTDQRLKHHMNPPKYVSGDELFEFAGVECIGVCLESHFI